MFEIILKDCQLRLIDGELNTWKSPNFVNEECIKELVKMVQKLEISNKEYISYADKMRLEVNKQLENLKAEVKRQKQKRHKVEMMCAKSQREQRELADLNLMYRDKVVHRDNVIASLRTDNDAKDRMVNKLVEKVKIADALRGESVASFMQEAMLGYNVQVNGRQITIYSGSALDLEAVGDAVDAFNIGLKPPVMIMRLPGGERLNVDCQSRVDQVAKHMENILKKKDANLERLRAKNNQLAKRACAAEKGLRNAKPSSSVLLPISGVNHVFYCDDYQALSGLVTKFETANKIIAKKPLNIFWDGVTFHINNQNDMNEFSDY